MEQEQLHDSKRQKNNEETIQSTIQFYLSLLSDFVVTEEARRVLALLETSLNADFPVC